MKIVNKRFYKEETKVVDLQIKDTHNFAIGSSKIIVHNSWIRPRGSFIHGIGVESPGAVKYMELYDKSSDIVTAGSGKKSTNKKAKGKIRKGAMMGLISSFHPDVVEFITAKQQPGRLTKFNMSVDISDDFMQKVIKVKELKELLEKDTEPDEYQRLLSEIEETDKWNLRFPDTTFERYKEEWMGDIKSWEEKNYPVIVYNTVSASWLWNLIMESTFRRAEPGIVFLDRANYYNPLVYGETIVACNPCVTGDTLVLTDKGHLPIETLIDKEVNIWNGEEFTNVIPFSTGINPIMKIELDDGSELKCTPYHRWIISGGDRKSKQELIEARNLTVGMTLSKFDMPVVDVGEDFPIDGYSQGFFSGDGSNGCKHSTLYNTKFCCIDKLIGTVSEGDELRKCWNHGMMYDKIWVPVNGSKRYCIEWLSGLLDSDGTVTRDKNGNGIQIVSINKKFLNNVRLMLTKLGVKAKVVAGKEEGYRLMPDGTGGTSEYFCNTSYRLLIGNMDTYNLMSMGLDCLRLNIHSNRPQRDARRFVRIKSIKHLDINEETFCFTEPKTSRGTFNGIVTAQCSEQMLAPGGICCLGSLNLTQFIDEKNNCFDLKKIEKYTRYMNRFLDNVNTISNAPLPEYVDSMRNKRRIGIGILGWGSALYILKTRFGSERANELREEVMSTIARTAYMSSIDLAEEKGMFTYCIPEKHIKSPFIELLNLPKKYMDKLLKVGIRNSSLLSIQPTGNTSTTANIVSGGLEPVFLSEYIRTVIVNTMPEHIKDVCPKWYEGEWYETEMFRETKEGDETILRGIDENGVVYKIDKNRGLTKEVPCEDYGVRYLKKTGEWDATAEWASTTSNLGVEEHLNDLKGFAKWLDSSASKCVSKGTFINTNKGIFKIEDICLENTIHDNFINIENKNLYVIDKNGDKQKITQHYNGGNKPCYLIKFNNGYEIICSETHSFLTEHGWVQAKEIDEDMKVFYRVDSNYDEVEYIKLKQPEISSITNSKTYSFPEVWDEDMALFFGMWMADGFTNINSVGVVEKDEQVFDTLNELFPKIFGIEQKINIDKRNSVRTHFLNSRYLVKYFRDNFGENSLNKKVPDEILKSKKSVQLEFLKGLSLDGYISYGSLVIYEGYSSDIARSVAEILQRLGYRYRLGRKYVKTGKLSNYAYSILVFGDENAEISCVEDHKNGYERHGYNGSLGIPRFIEEEKRNVLLESIGRGTKESEYRRNIRNSFKNDGFIREGILSKVNWSDFDKKLSCVKVTKKEFVGNREVFDISVENTNSYLIGGIISHNTINLPNDYPFEDFQNVYLDAYKTGYIKGVTTYRAGTMTSVLSAKEEQCLDCDDEEIIIDDIKVPSQSPAIINTLKADGRKWYLTTVMDETGKRPVALFVHTNHPEKEITTHDAVEKLLELAVEKKVPQKWIEETVEKIKSDNNPTKIARCISLNLRHGVLIKNVANVLADIECLVGSFLFQIRKYLMSYIKDGEKVGSGECPSCGAKDSFVYQEGCTKCLSCGMSKCS